MSLIHVSRNNEKEGGLQGQIAGDLRELFMGPDDYSSAGKMRNYNAEEAQKNRDFQLMMSNTAHQREMADLEAAGLNPMAAATSGAQTLGGATASVSGSSQDVGAKFLDFLKIGAGIATSAFKMANSANIAEQKISAFRDVNSSRALNYDVRSQLLLNRLAEEDPRNIIHSLRHNDKLDKRFGIDW